MIFQNKKMVESTLNAKEISLKELKAKALSVIQTKTPYFGLNKEYDVDIENCPPQELDNSASKVLCRDV